MRYRLYFAITSLFFCQTLWAEWQLDPSKSQINFVSTKNDSVSEVHHFTKLLGSIKNNGKAKVAIDLNSLETGINVRNERMRLFLFKVTQFPAATITADLGLAQLDALETGANTTMTAPFLIDLYNNTRTLEIEVRVAKLIDNQLHVTTTKPIILDSKQFGLEGGILELKRLAQLSSIDFSVPVTFDLTFNSQ